MIRSFLLVLAALALLAHPAAAQQPARTTETQVPLDPERGVLEVTPELRRELGLFEDVPGFQIARLFRQDDGTLVLEVARVEDGRLVRDRERVNEGRLAEIRTLLGERLAARGQTQAVDRSGRSGLVLAESIMGLGVYGPSIPIGFDIDSSRGQVAAYLLTAGLSFYLPYALTRGASVSVAERNAAVWGATRGAAHGVMLGALLEGDPDPNDFDDDERARWLGATATSIVETVIAYQTVDAAQQSEGEVAFWGAVGDFGIPYGLGLAYVTGIAEHMDCRGDQCFVEDFGSKGGYAAALGVALAAPLVAHWSGAGVNYTIGDARALRSFGLLGAQVVLPIAWVVLDADDEGDDPDKDLIASLLVGSAAGLWMGNRELRQRSLSGGDGALVLAGHVAGTLGALGITYLLDGDDSSDNEVLYMTASAVGGLAGSLLTLNAVSSRTSGSATVGSLSVEVNPGAALLPLFARDSARELRAPFLTLRF
jgi:hypothetical protein